MQKRFLSGIQLVDLDWPLFAYNIIMDIQIILPFCDPVHPNI